MWANNEINEPHSTGATNGKTITGQGQGSNVLCKSIKLSQSQEIVLPSFDQCQWKFLGRSNCQPRKLPHVISNMPRVEICSLLVVIEKQNLIKNILVSPSGIEHWNFITLLRGIPMARDFPA